MESGLKFEFESWKDPGDVWTIYGPDKGDRGLYLGQHPEGIYDEPTETIWNSHAFQIGAEFGGIRVHKREIILGMEVVGNADGSWQENDSAWRKAWNYKKQSKLWCETDEWGRRFLPVQLSKTPDFAPDFDPFKDQYGHVIYSGVAGYPRWIGKTETDKWVSTTDTTDGSWTYGAVEIANPTDTDLWMEWVLQASPGAVYRLPDHSWGDDRFDRAAVDASRVITMPALIAGEHVRVDTDDTADQVVSDLDTAIWQRMRGVRFLYPVPPGTPKTTLQVGVKNAPAGVGVQVRCRRHWTRPWGLDD